MSVKLENSKEVLQTTHSPAQCAGQKMCPIHKRSDHAMRSFPQHFRWDRGLMERICPHGIGHPDPDQWEFYVMLYGEEGAHAEFIHGCDGCGHEQE